MHTDESRYSVAAVWNVFYKQLQGTLWEDEDVEYVVYQKNHDAMPAALALRFVYQLEWDGVEAEDGVLATLKAAQYHYGTTYLTPHQVKEMGRRFTVHYRNRIEPMEDYLDEHCGPVGWHWLNDHGKKQVEQAVVRDSEIWIEDVNVSNDVWVFTKPGHSM